MLFISNLGNKTQMQRKENEKELDHHCYVYNEQNKMFEMCYYKVKNVE